MRSIYWLDKIPRPAAFYRQMEIITETKQPYFWSHLPKQAWLVKFIEIIGILEKVLIFSTFSGAN